MKKCTHRIYANDKKTKMEILSVICRKQCSSFNIFVISTRKTKMYPQSNFNNILINCLLWNRQNRNIFKIHEWVYIKFTLTTYQLITLKNDFNSYLSDQNTNSEDNKKHHDFKVGCNANCYTYILIQYERTFVDKKPHLTRSYPLLNCLIN